MVKIKIKENIYVGGGNILKKEKGFIISGIIYSLLILFILLMAGMLLILNTRKNVLDRLSKDALSVINAEEERDYIPIYTARDLENIGSGAYYVIQDIAYKMDLNANYLLMQDIDLAGYQYKDGSLGFRPIGYDYDGPFTGNFNGDNHTISNLMINRSAAFYVGLFGVIDSALIENVNLVNATVTGAGSLIVGGLVGDSWHADIDNCEVDGIITGGDHVGGLVGVLRNGSATNSITTGTVSGNVDIGGLIGNAQSVNGIDVSVTVDGNTSNATVNFVTAQAGGLIGAIPFSDNTGDDNTDRIFVRNNKATGNVIGKTGEVSNHGGGLIGYIREGLVEGNTVLGNVTSTSNSGGLIGTINVAGNKFVKLKYNYATGDVTAWQYGAGGLIGSMGINVDANIVIEENFATGNVEASSYGGGLIGASEHWITPQNNPYIIRNNYATGNVKLTTSVAPYYTGGLVGVNYAPPETTYKANYTNNYTKSTSHGTLGYTSGFIGYAGNVTNTYSGNYFDRSTSGTVNGVNTQATHAGVTAITTAQFKTTTAFSGWNTTDIWKFSNDCYPILKRNKADEATQRKLLGCVGKAFSYTGAVQTYTVPETGTYKIELWGASGGEGYEDIVGADGRGGYTSGHISLNKGEILYFYVGQRQHNRSLFTEVFNGGGHGSSPCGYSGGGASDVRLTNGAWNDIASLRSRIMVAGGGGAPGCPSTLYGYSGAGGAGGGLNAYNGTNGSTTHGFSYNAGTAGSGASQTSGGTGANSGSFGQGGNGVADANTGYGGTGSGGGGYYGGGSGYIYTTNYNGGAGGGGGSSFISGHNGCNAISSSGTHTGQANHYSGKVFTNTIMIDGAGYSWTNVKGGLMQMPDVYGATYPSGAGVQGNGYAKITLVP